MTVTALRTTINADLQTLGIDSLQDVLKYVKRKVSEANRTQAKERNITAPSRKAIERKKECIKKTTGIVNISEEDMLNDERLAYILRKNR